jgi:hypothetical protein
MDLIYVMINGRDWEDMVIYLNEEEAIQSSKTYPNIRIEIFGKNPDFRGYTPTYNYYEDGKMYTSANK